MPPVDETGRASGKARSEGPAPGTTDPIRQFAAWLDDAVAAGLVLPYAMAVATASPQGEPSVRMLLLRGFDERGFVFFTNHESRKGRDLAANPRAALVFHWDVLERQVRISGGVERVSRDEAAEYFATRPLGSRIAAWASRQGEVIESREQLERAYAELEDRYADGDAPLPPYWGGYRVVPDVIEFWEARPNRLHDRRLHVRRPDGAWEVRLLAP